jgi:hypothetical protein
MIRHVGSVPTLSVLVMGVEAAWQRNYVATTMFFGEPRTFDEILTLVAAFDLKCHQPLDA